MSVLKCLISVIYVFAGIELSSKQGILLNNSNILNLNTIKIENIIMEKDLVFSKNNNKVFIIQQNKNGIELIQTSMQIFR